MRTRRGISEEEDEDEEEEEEREDRGAARGYWEN